MCSSDLCGIFTGIGPEVESNHVTLRIKYGKIPKKPGISLPIRGLRNQTWDTYLTTFLSFWHATVASSRRAWRSTLLGQARAARRGQDAGSALLRNEALHTVLTGPRAVSCLVFFAQSARSCRFTLGWRWRAAQAENQLDTGRFAIKGMASIRVLDIYSNG